MYEYRVDIVKVVDGDTVDVDIDLGFGMTYKKQRVRMKGIDTPESRTRDLVEKKFGLASKEFLKSQLKDQKIELVSHDKGKFGRILGELFVGGSAYSINKIMIDNHYAVLYDGQSKEDIEANHLLNRERLTESGLVV